MIIEFEDGSIKNISIMKTYNRLKNVKFDKKVSLNHSVIEQLKFIFELEDISTFHILYIYKEFLDIVSDKTKEYEIDSVLASVYGVGVIDLDEDKKTGLFLNLSKINAIRSLEMITSIGTAVSGNKETLSNLLIMAGQDKKEVDKLISRAKTEELHQKHLDK